MIIPLYRASFCFAITGILFLTACGGGGGGSSSRPIVSSSSSSVSSSSSSSESSTTSSVGGDTVIGAFIGSPVEGLAYTTDTLSGITNALGEFEFIAGESIVFSIGDILFPSVLAAEKITPFTLAGSSHTDNIMAGNIARLLQTLDTNGDLSDGITLAPELQTLAAGLTVDFSSASFAQQVVNLVSNSGAVQNVLIGRTQAMDNLLNALYPPFDCEKTHSRVGGVANLSTIAHAVSGRAEIINDCTLRLTNFNYDGGGLPDVYVYGAENGVYTVGFRIGDNLFAQEFHDDVLQLMIPNADALEALDGISIWCEGVSVSFGDATFTMP